MPQSVLDLNTKSVILALLLERINTLSETFGKVEKAFSLGVAPLVSRSDADPIKQLNALNGLDPKFFKLWHEWIADFEHAKSKIRKLVNQPQVQQLSDLKEDLDERIGKLWEELDDEAWAGKGINIGFLTSLRTNSTT